MVDVMDALPFLIGIIAYDESIMRYYKQEIIAGNSLKDKGASDAFG
jgi:hypothetical protein